MKTLDEFYGPLPPLRAELGLVASYSSEQCDRMRLGFAPADMDDRWALRFDAAENSLKIHRSWTGFCIFLLVFRGVEDGWVVGASWVNRDPEQYRGTDVNEDRARAVSLIDRYLLSD